MKQIDSVPFLTVILKYKKPLGILAFVIALVTVFFTKFVVQERFDSEAIFYVTKLPEPETILPPQEFAEDEDTEGMIQILQSKGLRDSVVKHFDLISYYEIDTVGNKKWVDALDKKFFSNVNVETTNNDAISVKVEDHSPEKAAELANYITETAGKIRLTLFKDFLKGPITDRKKEYLAKVKEVDVLQTKLVTLGQAVQTAGTYSVEAVNYERIKKEFESEVSRMNELKNRYDAAQSHYNGSFTAIYWVSKAEPKYKKVFPKISVVTVLITFSITSLVILLLAIKERVEDSLEEE
ncbi:MAG: hypothetical protein GY827_02315 [Cytophagales bacterium]|nr:hypothetical protein [Cytophagales bacterium]